nr:E3 ubiquitin-protein ligase RNF220 [Misgurnus anguillicaudatus]XP_055023701.1 E3 ubiquitin-protein ligase RNF220 [Misgurnus anguillicaudatus]XP_055023702.1 E3 ubiquitin-protein ligase RNF220 [Misgurnus anguillicaudatus]XP_055023703.1 E3 ubiquitin-protein ligase RNF220 [Misgurnus anguillicaudatus]XP_055023704.1 E3 ubiquitin-protein ligase RNF220 [Misgurnus anguillicaudatus]XP_055023705.1 E3 ubiquitin-protein ligase RNF220 [Misgurnus anguillicaudatus]XP_055023706.1 E3 ubiquitin-protein ligas
MDLHRTAFKMENSYMSGPLTSPALMVLASTAEAGRDASVPCQPPRPFGVPVTLEKDMHLPFPSGSYTFASMYHRQGGFPPRDFPTPLLHLHPQFAPPNLDCSPLGMLNHGGVGAFRPFSSPPEERDGGGYQSAFLPAKRLKGGLEPDAAPHLRYTDVEVKEFDFGGAHVPAGSPSALRVAEDVGKKLFSLSGLLANAQTSSGPEEHKETNKIKSLYDTQTPMCPICQSVLRPGELQEHMEEEMERLMQLQNGQGPAQKEFLSAGQPKSLFSMHIKREGPLSVSSPRPADEAVNSDRYQTFLRVRANRHTRLNARIGKLKRRKAEEDQRDGLGVIEDASVLSAGSEFEWGEQRRIQMVSVLRGFRGLVSSTLKEHQDSDADLDVDGDDTLEYGKAQYTEADVIPCSGKQAKDAEERRALRGVILNGDTFSRLSPEQTKLANSETPTTSNVEFDSNTSTTSPRTCKNSELENVSDDPSLGTLEALKTRIRDLEKQLTRGDRFKCLICMDSYTVPLTSIQCWHVHCEECWLRTLGAKKLCPQCNTITSPGDLRRVYL